MAACSPGYGRQLAFHGAVLTTARMTSGALPPPAEVAIAGLAQEQTDFQSLTSPAPYFARQTTNQTYKLRKLCLRPGDRTPMTW